MRWGEEDEAKKRWLTDMIEVEERREIEEMGDEMNRVWRLEVEVDGDGKLERSKWDSSTFIYGLVSSFFSNSPQF